MIKPLIDVICEGCKHADECMSMTGKCIKMTETSDKIRDSKDCVMENGSTLNSMNNLKVSLNNMTQSTKDEMAKIVAKNIANNMKIYL